MDNVCNSDTAYDNIRYNTKLMIERRGYSVISGSDEIVCDKGDGSLCVVYFVYGTKLTTAVIGTVIKKSLSKNIHHMIIIHSLSVTPDCAKIISNRYSDVCIETFTCDEMAFDLVKCVPRHSLVIGEKPKEWKMYPGILKSDIVARYYGFKPGDIVRVEDGVITYRRVKN